jgi:N-acetylmuramoyl-L-alanine amidase
MVAAAALAGYVCARPLVTGEPVAGELEAGEPEAEQAAGSNLPQVTSVKFWTLGETTRIAIEVSGEFKVHSERLSNPERLFFDLRGTTPEMARKGMFSLPVNDSLLTQIRVARTQTDVTRVVLDLAQPVTATTSQLADPNRLVIEIKAAGAKNGSPALTTSREAPPAEVAAAKPEPVKAEVAPEPAAEVPAGWMLIGKRTKLLIPEQAPAVEVDYYHPHVHARLPPRVKIPPVGSPAANTEVAMARKPEPKLTRTANAAGSSKGKGKGSAANSGVTSTASPAGNAPTNSPADMGTSAADGLRPDSPGADAVRNEPTVAAVGTGLDASAAAAPIGSAAVSAKMTKPAANRIVESRVTRESEAREFSPARQNSNGTRTLTRALGLKLGRVVLDPGHGGHDVGTQGPSGYFEKDLVLDVAHRLGMLLEGNLGSEVVYTRSDDRFIPLEERTRLANEHKADLFLSIHANSSPYRTAAGAETYILNFTTSKGAMDVAARENASSEKSIFDLQELLQKIAQRDKAEESREFAQHLQNSLASLSTRTNEAAKNRGIKKAPFVVLIGASMPSVLAEIGFLTNTNDEALLRKPEYRQKIAEALFKGVSSYADSLSHEQVAKRQ